MLDAAVDRIPRGEQGAYRVELYFMMRVLFGF